MKKKLTEWPKQRKSRRLGHYQVICGSTGVADGGSGGSGVIVAILRPFFAIVVVGFTHCGTHGVCFSYI